MHRTLEREHGPGHCGKCRQPLRPGCAAGFWVEGGQLAWPVDELTIAGNLRTMFTAIEAVGSEADPRSHIRSGPILVGSMTVAGGQ